MDMFKQLVSVYLLLLSCYILSVHSQGEGCPVSCGNCELRNAQSLQNLVEAVVNRTLNNSLRNVEQRINDSVDEKIADSQRDIPG